MNLDDVWRKNAACIDRPELFFPADGERVAPARRICADCPVKKPCLDFAMRTRPEFGVWAGYTANELLGLRRAARRRERLAS